MAFTLTIAGLRRMAEIAEEIGGHSEDISQALSEYEEADNEAPEDRADFRENARETALEAIRDLLERASALDLVSAKYRRGSKNG